MGLKVAPFVVFYRVASFVAHVDVPVLSLYVDAVDASDVVPDGTEAVSREAGAGVTHENQQCLVVM